jgi:hypothetical protein
MPLVGATGCAAIWGGAAGADGVVTTGAAGGRLDGAFDAALLSRFGSAAEVDFGSSAGATDDFASSTMGGADFSSGPFDVSAAIADGFELDSADAGGAED